MPSLPSLPTSLTTLVLALCWGINIALLQQGFSFVQTVSSLSSTRRLPYPDELSIEHEPVVLLTVHDEHYKMDAHDDWASLFPRGFAPESSIAHNSSLGSSDRQRRPTPTQKVPSMYNQLWCLNELRKIYMTPGWEKDECRDRQVHRCLNLIRQALLCNGDTALEPTQTFTGANGEPVSTGASGYGVNHVCRDWAKIRAATEAMFENVNYLRPA